MTRVLNGDMYINVWPLPATSDGREHRIQIQFCSQTPDPALLPGKLRPVDSLIRDHLETYVSFPPGEKEDPRSQYLSGSFKLSQGKGFVESAIETYHRVLMALAHEIAKPHVLEALRGFTVKQRQEVFFERKWVDYAEYLKETMPLLQV
jgi:hypothetical protein